MKIFEDWLKVMDARQRLEDATTLPERFYASCSYSDECRTFCETHKYLLGFVVRTADFPKDRAP